MKFFKNIFSIFLYDYLILSYLLYFLCDICYCKRFENRFLTRRLNEYILPYRPTNSSTKISLIMDVALDGLWENSICTFAVCSARYKTRPGLVYHYGHSHSTSSGDPAKELSPSPAEVEPRSVADTAASNQPGWSQNQLSFLTFL